MDARVVLFMSNGYYGDSDGEKVDEDDAFASAIEAGRILSVGIHEHARDYINDEWWSHWEVITGEPGKRGGWFSCSC